MVNERRVKQMIRMTMFEKKYGEAYLPIMNYKKKEYVSGAGMSAFFGGTLFFLVVYALIIMAVIGSVIDNLSKASIVMLVVVGLFLYSIYIFVHVAIARTNAKRRYKRGRRAIKLLSAEYDELESIYLEEENRQSVSDMDWKEI